MLNSPGTCDTSSQYVSIMDVTEVDLWKEICEPLGFV